MGNWWHTNWTFANFCLCKKWMKVGQILSKTLRKFTVFSKHFLGPSLSVLMKFCFVFISLMSETFCFNQNLQLPTWRAMLSDKWKKWNWKIPGLFPAWANFKDFGRLWPYKHFICSPRGQAPGTIFTTLHFLRNLRIGPMS